MLIRRLGIDSLLSFGPDADPFDMQSLNVLIGPNGSGKSNVIEVLALLRATPTDFAAAIREGGGAFEWLWKGCHPHQPARINIVTAPTPSTLTGRSLRYRLDFTSVNERVEVLDEAIEEVTPVGDNPEPFFYYRFQKGHPVINIREQSTGHTRRSLQRYDLFPDQSVLAQAGPPGLCPELTWIGRSFGEMQFFREWTFGRHTALRQPQPANLQEDRLLPDARNLALVLNQIEHESGTEFNDLLKRFFPRFERMTTRVSGGTVQFYLHEKGFHTPVPSARLSDGTIRFIAILASLMSPRPAPLVCIEEPELGLHPDALTLIADLLVKASSRMQILVTTHSEALVSALTNQPDAIIACERPGASTAVRRLDPERLASWLNDYKLGDLWRMGELGANP